jgi:alpha-galactosidase
MKFRQFAVFSMLLLTGGLFLLLAQTDLTGYWVLRIPRGDGTFGETFFNLKQDGETLTGEQVGGRGAIPIHDGIVKDGKIHFEVGGGGRGPAAPAANQPGGPARATAPTPPGRGRGGMPLRVYDGTIENGKITLMMEPRRGQPPVASLLEKSSKEAAMPPARLELPELHDVRDNGLVRTPPMGWNSWNKFAGRIDDKTVREIADAMVTSGMKDAGYIYVNIDDTWELGRDAKGNITTNTKFPNMKALTGYVHSKGLKVGIYSSPGPKTCAGYEGSYGHEEQDAKTWASWGIDYLKYDWCGADRIYKDEDMQAVYQKMGDALLKAGRPIVYSLCQYGRNDVWVWGSKVGGNLWRTTGDISDRWESMAGIGFNQFRIAPYIKPGHFNDPDMLEIGNSGMSGDEYRTHMSLWSMLAAPLLAGNDVRDMTDEIKSVLLNKEVIAIDQDPEAMPIREVSNQDNKTVLMRPLKGNDVALAMFNRTDDTVEMSVRWRDLGIGARKRKARDLWKHEDVDVSADEFKATVPKHGVVLLKVTAGV